jgi:hypothetical protein
MANAVHLEDVRCDGGAHEGCQAGCLIFWKEAWLKRTMENRENRQPVNTVASVDVGLAESTRVRGGDEGEPRFRCQATELLRFTTAVRRRERWDPRFYLRDLTSRNVSITEFVFYGLRAILNAFLLRWFGVRYPHVCGLATGPVASVDLNLQPGEYVQVRSKQEIMQTLNSRQRNKGLWFDVEMLPYCESGAQKVLRRVEKIVDEKSGRLIKLANPCLILDGVTCSGKRSSERMFCPRSIYPYWREVWLERTPDCVSHR